LLEQRATLNLSRRDLRRSGPGCQAQRRGAVGGRAVARLQWCRMGYDGDGRGGPASKCPRAIGAGAWTNR